MGDRTRGQALYEEQCQSCHGTDGVSVANGGDAQSPLNVSAYTQPQMISKIIETMPLLDPAACGEQCATDINAYLQTWVVSVELSCNPDKPISYSPQALKLLTRAEYQNSLEDLLGVTKDYTTQVLQDSRKGKMPNNATANVDENGANRYWNNAVEIAAWAVENDKPFACTPDVDCGTQFVEEFAYKLFRRPLTAAEKEAYTEMFNRYPGAEGMELALTAALNSPQFLYRSELGRMVDDVLNGPPPEPIYVPADNAVTVEPGDLSDGGSVVDGFKEIGLYQTSRLNSQRVSYTLTGRDLIQVQIKGDQGGGAWPTLRLVVNNEEIATRLIDFSGVRTITFNVNGMSGEANIQLNNNIADADHPPNGRRSIYVGGMVIAGAVEKEQSVGDVVKLMQADPESYVLTPYEYAANLSYVLTGSTPDDELLEAAANEGLDTEEQVLAQVNRLLDSPRGREQMGRFAGYWFDTDKITSSNFDRDNELFPTYTDEVREAMAEEVRQLFSTIFYDTTGDLPFEKFYSGDFTVVNSTLASYYGLSGGPSSPDQWVVVDNLDERGGIVTTGAFMTVNAHPDKTSPIKRAVNLREQMLCQHIDPPPLLVEDRTELLELAEAEYQAGIATDRRYYEVITDARSCDSCHKEKINPLFGMEDFNQVGLWRDSQKGSTGMTLPIDNTGVLYGPENVNDLATQIPFTGAKDLSKKLGELNSIHSCLVEKSFRFVTGLPVRNGAVDTFFEPPLTEEQQQDFGCGAQRAMNAYSSNSNNPRAALTELVLQDLIRFRK